MIGRFVRIVLLGRAFLNDLNRNREAAQRLDRALREVTKG